MTAELKPFRAGDDQAEWLERLSRVFEDNPYLEQLLSGKLVPKSQKQTMLGDAVTIGGTLSVSGDVSLDASVVVNESGDPAHDFRVEGDTQDKLLFCDADQDTVGIRCGTSPSATFHVNTTGTSAFRVGTTAYVNLSENQIWAKDDLLIQNEATGGSGRNVQMCPGSAGGRLILGSNYATNVNDRLTVYGGSIFNENGNADEDFRVESDTDANCLFVDGGTNCVGVGTNAPTIKLDVNSDSIRIRTAKTPASATATGTAGQICWDASFIYVCTATDTWVRAAIATWP